MSPFAEFASYMASPYLASAVLLSSSNTEIGAFWVTSSSVAASMASIRAPCASSFGKGRRVAPSRLMVTLAFPGAVTQTGCSSPPAGPGRRPKTFAAAPRTSSDAVATAAGGAGGAGLGFFPAGLEASAEAVEDAGCEAPGFGLGPPSLLSKPLRKLATTSKSAFFEGTKWAPSCSWKALEAGANSVANAFTRSPGIMSSLPQMCKEGTSSGGSGGKNDKPPRRISGPEMRTANFGNGLPAFRSEAHKTAAAMAPCEKPRTPS
mmetsp:Transcript_49984/g.140089  ORF Transcript_49984/g.140089 Transcript_49984/m.140089 type:complete len:263 (-) Transcript_49984:370-1158(-)